MTNSFTRKQVGLAVACALAAALTMSTLLGCSPPQAVAAPAINDKIYAVTPASLTVRAGVLSGAVTEMKVTERVEEGTGRVASPAKLTGKLVLKNTSADQSVRLVEAKILYIDAQGNPIKLEKDRTEPTIKVAPSYGASERLDPGQDATQAIDVDFPVAALKARKLKDIRVDLSYIPSQFKEEKLSFAVSIGGQ
ncbi:MAG TPA: hypothetical protein VFK92_02530 [Burkholderiales bacterium]|nr:hypothetical protein [Burkholderiales bacterium]